MIVFDLVAAVLAVAAIAYLVVARLLDRRGFAGTATPFVAASLAAIPAGIALLGEDLEEAGAGAAAIVAGLLVAWLGARSGRRSRDAGQ